MYDITTSREGKATVCGLLRSTDMSCCSVRWSNLLVCFAAARVDQEVERSQRPLEVRPHPSRIPLWHLLHASHRVVRGSFPIAFLELQHTTQAAAAAAAALFCFLQLSNSLFFIRGYSRNGTLFNSNLVFVARDALVRCYPTGEGECWKEAHFDDHEA